MDRKIQIKKQNIQREILLLLICLSTMFMSIGYATINSISLNINGLAKSVKQEGIFITDYKYKSNVNADLENSKIENIYQTNLKSNITLSNTDPNSNITYEITIYNSTNKTYIFNKVKYVNDEENYSNSDIIYELENLTTDTIINSNETITFNITFHYKNNTLAQSNNLISYLNFYFEEYIANTLYKTITSDAVADNIKSTYVNSSTGIDFHSVSSDTNGKGIYLDSTTQNNNYPIYYFRGEVNNNNLIFANYCWKIVRTTENGGIKIIYNGTPNATTGYCDSSTLTRLDNVVAWNYESESPADFGYMYGERSTINILPLSYSFYLFGNDAEWDGTQYVLKDTIESLFYGSYFQQLSGNYHYTCLNSTGKCSQVYYIYYFGDIYNAYYLLYSNGRTLSSSKESMFSNLSSSSVKTYIDSWYADSTNGLINYSNKIENTIFCNERDFYSSGLKDENEDGINLSYSTAYGKLSDLSYNPSLACPNQNDSFTLKKNSGGISDYGNNALDYPVGLLSVDEHIYAGATTSTNDSYYLNSGYYYWTMSPSGFNPYNAYMYVSGPNGELYQGAIVSYSQIGIRPVISLIPNIVSSKGTGTQSDPYIIE